MRNAVGERDGPFVFELLREAEAARLSNGDNCTVPHISRAGVGIAGRTAHRKILGIAAEHEIAGSGHLCCQRTACIDRKTVIVAGVEQVDAFEIVFDMNGSIAVTSTRVIEEVPVIAIDFCDFFERVA